MYLKHKQEQLFLKLGRFPKKYIYKNKKVEKIYNLKSLKIP